MKLADNIHYYRVKANMYQSDLGRALGVSAQAVSKWELGKSEPDWKSLMKMCQLFGITSDQLLGCNDQEDPEDVETFEIRERLRRDPEYRLLFDAARKATPEHLKAAAAMLKALEPEEPHAD